MKKILALTLAVCSVYSTAHAQTAPYETHNVDKKLCIELFTNKFHSNIKYASAYSYTWIKNRSGDWIVYACADNTILKATDESIQKGIVAEKLRLEELEQQKIQRLKSTGFY